MARKIIFWLHLATGIVGGLLVGIMSFTGAALAFEKELIAWSERDARQVEVPAGGGAPLALEALLQRVRAAKPDAKINSLTLNRDPRAAVAVALPGNSTLYANPYTGELREAQARWMRGFMQTMRAWHVRLNFKPTPGRPTLGATLNAAANIGFVFLCVSGLVLWWPRAWITRVLRPSLWFVRGAAGKARDWNWHNVFGFWALPALFIMAVTGVVLSYRWAGELVFKLAGETPPAMAPRPAAPSANAKPVSVNSKTGGTPSVDPMLGMIRQEFPAWEVITLRFAPPLGANASPRATANSAVVRSANQWPPFSNTTIAYDPETGGAKQTDAYASLGPGQRARRWIRLLHTGEALRWPGELVAGLGCLAGCVLVWTGLALAWRRFFSRPSDTAANSTTA